MRYYEAYNERYKIVHQMGLSWFPNENTPEILEWIGFHKILKSDPICDFGCGEGRDTLHLANMGHTVTGIDISSEAIEKCKELEKAIRISGLLKWECIDLVNLKDNDYGKYSYCYSIGTLHMLVEQEDRNKFLNNIYELTSEGGKVLLVNKGDGEISFKTNTDEAFELSKRNHFLSGIEIKVASTTFRTVTWEEHILEIENAGFKIIAKKNTENSIYGKCMTVYMEKC